MRKDLLNLNRIGKLLLGIKNELIELSDIKYRKLTKKQE